MSVVSIACGQPALDRHFVLSSLAIHWSARGITVHAGEDFLPGAQAHVLHIDRTFITDADRPVRHDQAPVVNWAVSDISKRRVSVLRVTAQDSWDGPVIIKTDLNHFGLPEIRGLPVDQRERNRRRMADISWRSARRIPHKRYPVVDSIARVPRWIWEDDSLIVERFLPERDGDLYCLRGWMFFGSGSYGWRLRSTDPLVKTGSHVDHSYMTEVPDELVALRRSLGFDFGKFDYVVHEGRAIVFDVNKTPGFTGSPDSPRIIDLSHGIEDFLP
jgi:hypothetical protein